MKWLKDLFMKNEEESKPSSSSIKEPEPKQKVQTQISPIEVKQKLDNNESIVLVDVRGEDEREIASIEGSKHIPMHEIYERYPEISDDPNTEVIVFCHHGMRSEAVMHQLWGLGFQNTKNLAGGIDSWSVEIDPSIQRY